MFYLVHTYTTLILSQDRYLNMLLFTDDFHVNKESTPQESVIKLHSVCKQCNMKISSIEIKVVAFWGKEPIKTKIILMIKL